MSIHINDLLPEGVKLKEFKTGSELLLAYELGKYTKLLLEEGLSVDNVGIDTELVQTAHFGFIVDCELIEGIEPVAETDLPDYDIADFFLPSQNVSKVDLLFEEGCVIFNFNSNKRANSALNTKNRSTAYVSLMAFVLVKNYIDQTPNRKLIIDHEEYEQQNGEYDDLIKLQRSGILLESILKIKYKTQGVIQLPWQDVVKEYREKELMNRVYSSNEKYAFLLKEGLEIGDVVLRYSRTFDQKVEDTIGTLKSCYPAVIRDYNEEVIVLEYYRTVETRLTQQTRIEGLCAKVDGLKEALTPDDLVRATSREESIFLDAVGIGTCTYLEDTFIFEPVESDETEQTFKDKDGSLIKVELNTLDTIFAVFEDRGVPFNRDKFLNKYFLSKGKQPKYYDYV
ncbi:hypothetical protein [Cohnella sp. AR92]|uniref:hypothetical protein n=1 Tax=Cohnella sp. AR92 TaxID=648716 RepID=UPI000F8DFFD5|nr:hypothetical protein [Cohnella sp. AR92]RUS44554.1 hypothetical protein ELR57_22490 [Cohnella sp. AR92]